MSVLIGTTGLIASLVHETDIRVVNRATMVRIKV